MKEIVYLVGLILIFISIPLFFYYVTIEVTEGYWEQRGNTRYWVEPETVKVYPYQQMAVVIALMGIVTMIIGAGLPSLADKSEESQK